MSLSLLEKRQKKWLERLQIHFSCNLANMGIPCRCKRENGKPYYFFKCEFVIHSSWFRVFRGKEND